MTKTREGRKEAQDATDLQSFSQTNRAAAADWPKSQIAHLPDQCSQGFDDDPAYIGMLVVVITQICCCTSVAVKVLMILHTLVCCDHRYLLLYKCGSSSQGFDDDPAYIGMLVVVITDLLLLYKCSGSHQGLTDSVCLHVCLRICTLPTTPSAIMLLQPRGTQISTPHECGS
ncbi:unnamed protein product [Sphagnum troendelagicum]